jgi:hypothetical protein
VSRTCFVELLAEHLDLALPTDKGRTKGACGERTPRFTQVSAASLTDVQIGWVQLAASTAR